MAYGERWRPYRSVASWYLWRAADMKDLPLAGEQKAGVVKAAIKPANKKMRKPVAPKKAAKPKPAGKL